MATTPPPPPPSGNGGDSVRPWWKRWWAIGAAAFVLIGVIGSLSGETSDAPQDRTVDASPLETQSEPAVEAPTVEASTVEVEESDEPTPEPVAVADVTGVSESEATRTLEGDGFQVNVEEQEVNKVEDQGSVLEQRPPAGDELAAGETVTVVVGGEFVWADTITVDGTGDDVIDVAIPNDAVAIVRISHSGGSNFAIWAIDEAGSQQDLLVNTVGNYQGVRMINREEPTRLLEITADGSWSIEFTPLVQARRFEPDGTIEGTGDDIVVADESAPNAARALLSNSGDSNFAIWAYAGSGTDLLVNDIGPYEGTVRWPSGIVVLDITATGPWSIHLE